MTARPGDGDIREALVELVEEVASRRGTGADEWAEAYIAGELHIASQINAFLRTFPQPTVDGATVDEAAALAERAADMAERYANAIVAISEALSDDKPAGRMRARLIIAGLGTATVPTSPTDTECTTPGCDGDVRYGAPGRGHHEGCRYPLPTSPTVTGGTDDGLRQALTAQIATGVIRVHHVQSILAEHPAPHARECLNMASDNDCSCPARPNDTGGTAITDEMVERAVEAYKSTRIEAYRKDPEAGMRAALNAALNPEQTT